MANVSKHAQLVYTLIIAQAHARLAIKIVWEDVVVPALQIVKTVYLEFIFKVLDVS